MKNIEKLLMCVLGLCSVFLFDCSGDDGPGMSGLQNDFIDVAVGPSWRDIIPRIAVQ